MNGAARRPFYLTLTILGLVMYLWGFQGQRRLAAFPASFDREGLAYPVAFEGIQAGSPEAVRFLAEGWSPGQVIQIVDADGTRHQVRLVRAHGLPYLLVTCFNGLFFWAVCTFIFAPRVHRPAVTSFFWLSFLYGLSVMIGGIYFQRGLTIPAVLLGPLQLICLAALPVLSILIASVGLAAGTIAQEPPGPPKELDKFSRLLGSWSGSGTAKESPGGAATPWSGKIRTENVLGGHFVREDSRIEVGMPAVCQKIYRLV